MKIIDLTIPLADNMPVFPGDPETRIKPIATLEKDDHSKLSITLTTHSGTHIDAPFHFINGGKKLDDFPMGHFVGNAIALDCRGQKEISLTERELSLIQKDDIVFLATSHSDIHAVQKYFDDYPVISKKTADALVQKEIRIVGIDSPSPDKAPYDLHYIFLGKEICIVENLFNLKPLINKRFTCIIAPLAIKDGDGAPCRVIGMLP